MIEITCPRCKTLQKISANNLCSYCYFNFNNEKNKYDNQNIGLSIDYNKFDNRTIVKLLEIDKIKPPLEVSIFLIVLLAVFILSAIVFIYDNKIFYIKYGDFGFIELSSVFLSFITTYLIYQYISKKYDIKKSVEYIIPNRRKKEVRSYANKKAHFIFLLIVYNWAIVFFNIFAINDLSSIIFPVRNLNVFVYDKSSTLYKGEYTYYINVTNWKKNSEEKIKLKIPEKQWSNINENSSAKIKIKRGILDDVIWSLKQ